MEYSRPNKRLRKQEESSSSSASKPNAALLHHQQRCTSGPLPPPQPLLVLVPSLNDLLSDKRWDEAMIRLEHDPYEAANVTIRPSALAVACRRGAPSELIRGLLQTAPHRLRELLDSRGTPLHEAIVCEATSMETLQALLQTDELLDRHHHEHHDHGRIEIPPTRATLMQDVDGFTPLHLLIRRRFQWHVLADDNDDTNHHRNLMPEMLQALVSSCPESVLVPDRGEYEEPPIVYALKANIYAPGAELANDNDTDNDDNDNNDALSRYLCKVEARIYEMVQVMLTYAPAAAAQSFRGFRGDYTALHSAVFHGRYTDTIELLLDTEAAVVLQQQQQQQASRPAQAPLQPQAALLKNTQAELPLHFCAMRGERPRTVALLAKNAPQAVLQRDSSGLTPFHWLWIRFMSTLLSMEEDDRGEERFDIAVSNGGGGGGSSRQCHFEVDSYNDFSILEQVDFESDLRLTRRLDPPVDFLCMRHIPEDVSRNSDMHEWVNDIKDVLNQARTRHHHQQQQQHNSDDEAPTLQSWTRIQAVTALFWTKVVSMLRATKSELSSLLLTPDSGLVHAAFASQYCPPPIARIVALLFPHELVMADSSWRLPIHYAALRKFHAYDWLREDGPHPIAAAGDLLRNESLQALRDAIELSPREAMRVADSSNRLVIHHVIGTFIHACCQPARSSSDGVVEEMIRILQDLVSIYPECLSRRDGVTKLYPFLQSVACATEQEDQMFIDEKNSLNITYVLLRENPAVLCSLLGR